MAWARMKALSSSGDSSAPCWPRALNALVALGLRVLRREPLEHELSGRAILVTVLLFIGSWLAFGLQTWILARSVGGPDGAGSLTVALYALVTVGAVLRVAAALRFVDYNLGIDIAAIAWGGAFLLFLLGYAPVLWRPRLGEAR